MAGEEGFEPSHAGIKIQCLNQLGDSPAVKLGINGVRCSVACSLEWRLIFIQALNTAHSIPTILMFTLSDQTSDAV